MVDGELFVDSGDGFDFDALLPTHSSRGESRGEVVGADARTFAVFDPLVDEKKQAYYERPFSERRLALLAVSPLPLSKAGTPRADARDPRPRPSPGRGWRATLRGSTGAIAETPSHPPRLRFVSRRGRQDQTVPRRTASSAAFAARRLAAIASLLLGLYDGDELDHVGFVGEHERRRAPARRAAPRGNRRTARVYRRRARAWSRRPVGRRGITVVSGSTCLSKCLSIT